MDSFKPQRLSVAYLPMSMPLVTTQFIIQVKFSDGWFDLPFSFYVQQCIRGAQLS